MRHIKFMPGACLSAYLIGYARGRFGKSCEIRSEEIGYEYACGAVAALYFWAGLSKLWVVGFTWGQGGGLAMEILASTAGVTGWVGEMRSWIGTNAPLVSILVLSTLLVELTGLLFCFRSCRRAVAYSTTAMHGGVFALMGFHYIFLWSPLVLALALCPLGPTSSRSAQ